MIKNKIVILAIIFLMLFVSSIKVNAQELPNIEYQSHVQTYGWQDWVSNEKMSGTEGEAKRLEAIKIKLNNVEGGIEYQSHVQTYGWQEWVKNGELSGTEGEAKRLEAIKIKLFGKISEEYDVYYRTHVQTYGWQDWVKNGELSGTTGEKKRLEGIQIKLVSKKDDATIYYKSYIANDGWQDFVKNGELSGTTGQAKPIQKFNISLEKYTDISGDIMYDIYNNVNGWNGYVNSSNTIGQEGTNVEAIKIKLTGNLSEKYDIYYRVHVQSYGWLDWTKNDSIAGTIDCFRRLEAIEIRLESKNNSQIIIGKNSYKESKNMIKYSSHVQSYGWQNDVVNGEISGTTGESKRLEAYKVSIDTELDYNLKYQSYIEKRGWQNPVNKGEISGTTGEAKQIEAIKINLEGTLSQYYDIYYRSHVSKIGWLDWTKNGDISGSIGNDTKIEAIQIKLIKKTQNFDEPTKTSYVTGKWQDNKYINYFGETVTGFKFIDGIKYYFNSEGTMIGKNVKQVIDVSSWQDTIDWNTIKKNEDVDAAIIRVGWGLFYDDDPGIDSRFDYNIREVQRLNIPYSIYIYAYAKSDSAAEKEAKFVIDMMNKYNIPKNTFVWYDAENTSYPLSIYETVIPKFADYMNKNGYKNVGVYGSLSFFISASGNLNSPKIKKYPLWIAQYYKKIQYPGEFKGWQFTSEGYIEGISTRVDISMFY